jgi:hypothetical protein
MFACTALCPAPTGQAKRTSTQSSRLSEEKEYGITGHPVACMLAGGRSVSTLALALMSNVVMLAAS